jgi:hypothetical protein
MGFASKVRFSRAGSTVTLRRPLVLLTASRLNAVFRRLHPVFGPQPGSYAVLLLAYVISTCVMLRQGAIAQLIGHRETGEVRLRDVCIIVLVLHHVNQKFWVKVKQVCKRSRHSSVGVDQTLNLLGGKVFD